MHISVSSRLCVLLGAVLALGAAESQAASFQGLGFLPIPSPIESRATNVSGDGSTVVGSSRYVPDGGFAEEQAFQWTASGGMLGLGYLPDGFDRQNSASATSADGSVIVGSTPNAVNGTHGYRWTASGGMQPLGTLPGGTDYSPASGVSADGDTIVGTAITGTSTTGFVAHPYAWTPGGGMIALGDLAGGGQDGAAYAISANGSVIVGRSTSASGIEAFRWTQSAGMQALGDLAGGSVFAQALAISSDGVAIVGSGSSSAGTEAFLWTAAGGMLGLGDLPGGTFSSIANDVAAGGIAIVGGGRSAAGARAFLWTPAAGMRDLATVLASDFGIALGGWVLTSATGISDDGRVIVGTGRDPGGRTQAWMAIVPEPGTAAFVALGAVALGGMRRAAGTTR